MLMAQVSTAYGSWRQLPGERAPGPPGSATIGPDRRSPAQGANPGVAMTTALFHFSTLAILSVFVVLLLGLWNMMRGTSPNTSQKLMRWRVALQFLAILILMLAIFLSR
jgi:ABC-type Na+ efflux pump permease subunit